MSEEDQIKKSDVTITSELQLESGDPILLEDGSPLISQDVNIIDDISSTVSAVATLSGQLSLIYNLPLEGAELEQNEPALTINAVLSGTIQNHSEIGNYQVISLEDGQQIAISPEEILGIEKKETYLRATGSLRGSIDANSNVEGQSRLIYTLHADPAQIQIKGEENAIKVEQELSHSVQTLLTGTFTGTGSTIFKNLTATGIASIEAGVARTQFEKFGVAAHGTTTIPPSGINPNETWFRNRLQLQEKYGWSILDKTQYLTPIQTATPQKLETALNQYSIQGDLQAYKTKPAVLVEQEPVAVKSQVSITKPTYVVPTENPIPKRGRKSVCGLNNRQQLRMRSGWGMRTN